MNDKERILYREGRVSGYYQVVDRIKQGDTAEELMAWVLEQRRLDYKAIEQIVERMDRTEVSA